MKQHRKPPFNDEKKQLQLEETKKTSYMPKTSSDHYQTPDRVFDILYKLGYDARFYFDPCPLYSTFDGLLIDWHNWNYVNPPYSLLEKFIEKTFNEYKENHFSILLLPVKSDKDWWHDYIIKNRFKIIWIRGRLKFKNTDNPAPNSHCLVVMR